MMMSYDKKKSHIKLPSFNELTSKFATNLTINQNPSSTTDNPEISNEGTADLNSSTPSMVRVESSSSPTRFTKTPTEVKLTSSQINSVPITPTIISRATRQSRNIPQQLQHQQQQYSQQNQYQYQHQQIDPHSTTYLPQQPHHGVQASYSGFQPGPPLPHPGSSSASSSMVQNQPQQLLPSFQPETSQMSSFRFPPREQFAAHPPPQPPQLGHPPHLHQLQPQTPLSAGSIGTTFVAPQGFNEARRLSLQYPPYPSRHRKNDSYDSQTSLSTLADIASLSREDNYAFLLRDLEAMLTKFEELNRIINDVNNDFHANLAGSQRAGMVHSEEEQEHGQEGDVEMKLNREYAGDIKSLKFRFFKHFLENIPIDQLNEAIGLSGELNKFFQDWLTHREKEDMIEAKAQSLHTSKSVKISEKAAEKISKQRRASHQRNRSLSITGSKKTHLRRDSTDLAKVRKKSHDLHPSAQQQQQQQQRFTSKLKDVISEEFDNESSSGITGSSTKTHQPATVINAEAEHITQQPGSEQAGLINVTDIEVIKCKQCGSDDTPEWRRGPYGTRSLCNACGLFFGKLTKKFGIDEATRIMVERREMGNGDDRRIPST